MELHDYGKGFDYSSLYKYVRFYKAFPEILDSVSPKSTPLLSWTHYRVLLQVKDEKARAWYEKKLWRSLGESELCREMFPRNITIECSRPKRKKQWRTK